MMGSWEEEVEVNTQMEMICATNKENQVITSNIV